MQPFDSTAVTARFLAKISAIKQQTGDPEVTISKKIAGRKERIHNIKRGLASVDLEILHNLEQVYGVDQYEIIKGVSIAQKRQELEQLTELALQKIMEIKSKFQ